MDRALAVHSSGKSRDCGGVFFDWFSVFMDNTALGSPRGNGSQRAESNTAIESFWRCQSVEYSIFVGP